MIEFTGDIHTFAKIDMKTPCLICQRVIEHIKENGVKHGQVIIFRPDFNAFKNLTHYHIELVEDTGFNVVVEVK